MIRVRFAPSPTGYLHVGGARTALYNWLYAQSKGGKFILRIEDTDQERSTEKALKEQMFDLKWLGLLWDEGPEVGGNYGPYKQSERLHIYKDHADRLISLGKAYHCFCEDAFLEEKRKLAISKGLSPQYDGTCRALDPQQSFLNVQSGKKAVVRFLIPPKPEYVFTDLIRGEVRFPSNMVGDFVILRSDGMPVYNFCCVVDDALMKITHVLRAEEHLSNTLRQLMLYEAFDYQIPLFGHLSIILGPDKQKLSKRHGATSVYEFNQRGLLPEALNNYIALLGWSSPKGDEVIPIPELIRQFDIDRFHLSAAVFDETKLVWMNSLHLRSLPSEELWRRVVPFLERAGIEYHQDSHWQTKSIEAFKSAMETLQDAVRLYRPLADNQFEVSQEGKTTAAQNSNVIQCWIETLEEWGIQHAVDYSFLTEEEFQTLQDKVQLKCQVSGKNLFQPLRVAVVGVPQGVELKRLVPLIPIRSLKLRATKCLNS